MDLIAVDWHNNLTEQQKTQCAREWDEIAATTVKKMITGDGKAEKAEVEKHVLRLMEQYADGWNHENPFTNDNESDAMAVAISWLIYKGFIKPAKAQKELKNESKTD